MNASGRSASPAVPTPSKRSGHAARRTGFPSCTMCTTVHDRRLPGRGLTPMTLDAAPHLHPAVLSPRPQPGRHRRDLHQSSRAFVLLTCIVATLALMLSLPAGLQAAEATVIVPFGGGILRDDAQTVAAAAARIEALRLSTASLGRDSAALFSAETPARLLSLTAATFEAHTTATSVVGYPPEVGVAVNIRTTPRGGDAATALRAALRAPEKLELREGILLHTRENLLEARQLALDAARHRQKAGTESESPYDRRFAALARTLRSLDTLERALSYLDGVWRHPIILAADMRQVVEASPEMPLGWTFLGEALLQLDRPQDAVEALDRALALPDAPVRARLVRGIANLRLDLTALAVDDLSRVLREAPRLAPAWRARGAARMMRREYGPMCEDFIQACNLGDCEGLASARDAGHCLAPARPQTVKADD